MKFNKYVILKFIVFVVLLTSCQNKVDLIVHNGNVYTMGELIPKATAFAVDDGIFVDVGGDELLKKYKAKRILDLKSLPVYPGFIDSHCHLLNLGLSLQQVD